MIDYTLAKELKDAGWNFRSVEIGDMAGNLTADWISIDGVEYYIPTLEELIEACGDGFGGVIVLKQKNLETGKYSAKAFSNLFMIVEEPTRSFHDFFKGTVVNAVGDSRKEAIETAVIRLWLALNKK